MRSPNRAEETFSPVIKYPMTKGWRAFCCLIAATALLTCFDINAASVVSAVNTETCAEGYVHDASTGTCITEDPEDDVEQSYEDDENEDNGDALIDEQDEDDEIIYGDYFVIEKEERGENTYTLEEFKEMLQEMDYEQVERMETVEQEIPEHPDQIPAFQLVLEQMNHYFDTNMSQPEFTRIRDLCVNKHAMCAFWTSIGECEVNPKYMKIDCALACRTCDQLDVRNRCPIDPNIHVDIYKPGDLNSMFQRIANGPDSSNRKVQVLSHPLSENKTGNDHGPLPWVVIIDDFITVEECERLIELGHKSGYERSRDVGEEQADGTFSAVESKDRTSTNAWCQDECHKDDVVQDIMKRIEELTGIPDANSEHLQLLRYEEGQFYGPHHDLIEFQIDRPCGPRIITAFLYLNDVEAGGGTNFPEMNLTVMPKQGRMLLWPSVLDHDLNQRDEWTHHQALPVEKGIKYGANGWLHLRDFKTPHSVGCA